MTQQIIEEKPADRPLGKAMEALDEAITACDGVAKFAARIDVSSSSPSMWKTRKRVPAEHCPAIERETGVTCERLRPDIPWEILRLQTAKSEQAGKA